MWYRKSVSKVIKLSFYTLLLISLTVGTVSSGPPKRLKVLISFDSPPGFAEESHIKQAGGQVKYRYHLVNVIAATLPETAISRLQDNPRITDIEPDLPMHAVDIELDNAWGVKKIGAGDVHSTYNNRGSGVNIAIIDSGINYNHPELDDNYAGGWDFAYGDADPWDVYGHGTHVAGIACAEDYADGESDGVYGVVGVAPMCNLFALQVLDDSGWGFSSDLIAALEWAVDQGMDVANLSLGWDHRPAKAVEKAFTMAEQAGMVIVACACNNGDASGIGENVCWPGKYASVIAVAATDSDNIRADFSSTGSEVELAAPGVAVFSTWNDDDGYASPDPVCLNPDDTVCYKFGSGTSMASPHVAGTAALIIASGISDANNNGRINDEVRQRLIDTSDELGLPGWDPWYGYGLVNALEAVTGETPPNPDPVIEITGVSPSEIAALEQDTLTIYGSGFLPATEVTFVGGKGTPPLITSISVNGGGTVLFVEVVTKRTPKVTIWSIRVTNPDGATALLPDSLTINP